MCSLIIVNYLCRMKSIQGIIILLFLSLGNTVAQTILPSTAEKIEPEALVSILESPEAEKIVILNTGPVNNIKNAIQIGAVEEKKNVKKLRKFLRRLPKDTYIVYYCGCCPFATCPNLLPAAQLLEKMKFTNYKALNLPKSLKLDWINKGYPMESN